VNLTEWPTFIVCLDEVEVVHFERVTSTTKSCDMVVVYKDHHRKPSMISHIPTGTLDQLKEWLNNSDIKYYEGPMSLNWNNLMKAICDDEAHFTDEGGWKSILGGGQDDEEGDEEDSEESSFEPPSEEESDEDEDDEEDAESEEDEDSESDASMDSNESEGKDWSDLEEEAANDDRTKMRDEESDRKRKGSGRGNAPPVKRRR